MSQFMVSSYPYNDKYKTGNSTKLKQASTLLNLVKKHSKTFQVQSRNEKYLVKSV